MSAPSLMDLILAPGAISVRFQPILELNGVGFRLHAVESLVSGPAGSTLEPAEILFDYVRLKREQVRMDRACVAATVAAAAGLPEDVRVSVNVHAATLSRDPDFLVYLSDVAERRGIKLPRLIVELVEFAPEWFQGPSLTEALEALRYLGIAIALDDVGLAHSNFRMILDCRPDFLKIDRYFVKGVHRDHYRGAVLEAVALLADRFGARVVAEGVEDRADLDSVLARGIDLIQGFVFAPALTPWELLGSPFIGSRSLLPQTGPVAVGGVS